MKLSTRTSLSLLALSLAAGGCSTSLLESKRIDYKGARKTQQRLDVPPDLARPSGDERFAVPEAPSRGVATFSGYSSERGELPRRASEQGLLPSSAAMHIERAGSQRWLVIAADAEELWPQIKDFWMELGFILNIDNPAIGVMETDWAEDRAKLPQDFVRSTIGKVLDGLFSTPERDKFRTRLEQGTDGKTVEVYISHRGMVEIYPNEARDSTIWQPRPADPELEAEMLRRLMVHLGAEEERAEAVLSTPAEAERASLQKSADGRTTLAMDESFDRAWRRVGLALDRIGFTVEDRDRAQGLYYVRYVDPDAEAGNKKGFFSRLAFWRDDEKPAAGSEYRLHVGSEGAGSLVRVLSREGGEDASPTAQRMLGLLHAELR